jgi:proliferating cell nuclear antigen
MENTEVGKATESEKREGIEPQKTEQVDVQAQSESNEPKNATVDEYDQPGLLVGAAKRRAAKAEELAKSQEDKEPAKVAPELSEAEKKKLMQIHLNNVRGVSRVDYGLLKPVLQILTRFADEGILEISREGLHTRIVDPAHVAMVDVVMSRETFIEWYFDENDARYAIALGKILDLKLNPKDTVTFEWNKSKSETCTVSDGLNSIRIPLLDPNEVTTPKMPVIVAENYFVINAGYLKDFLGKAEHVSDEFKIMMDPVTRSVILKAKSDSEEVKTEIPIDMMKDFRIYGPDTVSALYPAEYFMNFLRFLKKNDELKIELKTNYPVTVRYSGNRGYTNITFLLAPRAE